MSEDRFRQPNPDRGEGLPLRLIDGHGEGQLDGELAPANDEGKVVILRNEVDSWQVAGGVFVGAIEDFAGE